jgi:hypothetical protein
VIIMLIHTDNYLHEFDLVQQGPTPQSIPCGKIKIGELSSALSVPGTRNADLTRDDRFVLGGL